MDITNLQFYVAIAVAPVATLVVALVANMFNNTRASEIRTDLKDGKREVMDRVEGLRSELRTDLKEFRAEMRGDLREAVSQIRADLAGRTRHASGGGGHTG
jgi:hypothetical protein